MWRSGFIEGEGGWEGQTDIKRPLYSRKYSLYVHLLIFSNKIIHPVIFYLPKKIYSPHRWHVISSRLLCQQHQLSKQRCHLTFFVWKKTRKVNAAPSNFDSWKSLASFFYFVYLCLVDLSNETRHSFQTRHSL